MKRLILKLFSAAAAGSLFCGCSSGQITGTQASDLLAPALGLGGALAGSYVAKDEDDGHTACGHRSRCSRSVPARSIHRIRLQG